MKSQLRIALPVAATAVGILLAGCASSGTAAQSTAAPASASSTPAAASSAPAAARSAPAVASSSPASATVTPSADSAALPQCSAADLTIAYTNNSQINNGALAGMSHHDSVVTFTNKSSASCQTAGYPGVAALDAAGRQIKQAARVAGSAPAIVLRPGEVASALISANTASCAKLTTPAGLLVTAPNQRTSTRLAGNGEFCLNSLQIGTLQRGNAAGLKLG
jgi:membrane-bound inhibitor of C-type lysozyme